MTDPKRNILSVLKVERSRTAVTHLALVKVIDNLLVKLVLELSLRGSVVVVPLGQVGGTRFIWPLQKDTSIRVTGVQVSPERKVIRLQEINSWRITDANVCEIDE